MGKLVAGFDIGAKQIKIAVTDDGALKKTAVFPMPDNLIKNGKIVSGQAVSDLIKKAVAENKISAKYASVVLNPAEVFIRTLNMPLITEDKLRLNLPYEFRNYIGEESEKYFYDYAVLDITQGSGEQTGEMSLIAAATLKNTINDYKNIFKHAGFKLKAAAPAEIACSALIGQAMKKSEFPGADDVFCIIDIGYASSRVHVYKGGKFDVSRSIECGSAMIDAAIADVMHVDEHIAATYKETNYNNVLNSDYCNDVYHTIAIEVNKTIKFYSFNNRDTEIQYAFACGGGAKIKQLTELISSVIGMDVHGAGRLAGNDSEDENLDLSPAAIGVSLI